MKILERADQLMEDIKVKEALSKKIVKLRGDIKKNEDSHKAEIKKLQDQIAKKEAQFEKANKKILEELNEACEEWERLLLKTPDSGGKQSQSKATEVEE